MNNLGWQLVSNAANLLDTRDREVVLGDLAETQITAWRGLADVIGLATRRQTLQWRNWQPWLASVGLALPCSFSFMGFSLAVCAMFRQFIHQPLHSLDALSLLASRAMLLFLLAWAVGYLMGRLSPRTLWASVAFTFVPCLFCFSRFVPQLQTPWELLLFVLPAGFGVVSGIRQQRIGRVSAIVLASLLFALVPSGWNQSWALLAAMILPGWYLIITGNRETAASLT
jgi:hypothetical protein